MVEIRPILIKDIDLYWPNVAPMIDKSLDYGYARIEWTIEGIREVLSTGEKTLWVVFDEKPIAAVITSITEYKYTGKRMASVDFAGGERFKEWSMFTDYIEPVYKAYNCDIITIAGRLGWLRLHTDKGFKPIYHVIGKSLNV